jgi:RNA polymerase sigma factor for flagellar operon FliA
MSLGPAYAPVRAEEKDRLIKSHLHMVSFLTERMVSQVPAFMTREDIASAAMVGLVDAANRFKPSMGVLFKTFAEKRMRGAVLDEVRRMDWFSRSMRQKQSRVCHAVNCSARSATWAASACTRQSKTRPTAPACSTASKIRTARARWR